jgi:hypothetical protein
VAASVNDHLRYGLALTSREGNRTLSPSSGEISYATAVIPDVQVAFGIDRCVGRQHGAGEVSPRVGRDRLLRFAALPGSGGKFKHVSRAILNGIEVASWTGGERRTYARYAVELLYCGHRAVLERLQIDREAALRGFIYEIRQAGDSECHRTGCSIRDRCFLQLEVRQRVARILSGVEPGRSGVVDV